ncbi:hypothetical protein EVA_18547, partial [gut metagenome]
SFIAFYLKPINLGGGFYALK